MYGGYTTHDRKKEHTVYIQYVLSCLSLIDYSSRCHLQAGELRGDLGDLAATWAALGGALVRVRAGLGVSLGLGLG